MYDKVEERLINAYVVLVMAERNNLYDAPENLRDEIKIRIAQKEVEKLSVEVTDEQ